MFSRVWDLQPYETWNFGICSAGVSGVFPEFVLDFTPEMLSRTRGTSKNCDLERLEGGSLRDLKKFKCIKLMFFIFLCSFVAITIKLLLQILDPGT